MTDVSKVTRVEVINHVNDTGRAYVFWPESTEAARLLPPFDVQLSIQDDGRTLKVFLTKKVIQKAVDGVPK